MFNLNRRQWGFDWAEFLLGILFLVVAYGILRVPRVALAGMAIVFGLIALVSGITTLAGYTKLRDFVGARANIALALGIFDIVIALIFLLDINAAVLTLSFLFALWFIADSIERLIVVSHLRSFGAGYYWFSILLDILTLIVGIMLLFNPVIAALSINLLLAFYFILFGINAIVIAFARRN